MTTTHDLAAANYDPCLACLDGEDHPMPAMLCQPEETGPAAAVDPLVEDPAGNRWWLVNGFGHAPELVAEYWATTHGWTVVARAGDDTPTVTPTAPHLFVIEPVEV